MGPILIMYIIYANIVWAHTKVYTISIFALHRPIINLYIECTILAAGPIIKLYTKYLHCIMLQSSSGRPRMGMCLPSTHMSSRDRLLSVFRRSIPYQSCSLSNKLQQFLNNSFSAFHVFQTPPFAPATCDSTVLLN